MASDFIQGGRLAIAVSAITWVEQMEDGSVTVGSLGDEQGSYWHIPAGHKAKAFLAWWANKASVYVLWQEPDDESPT